MKKLGLLGALLLLVSGCSANYSIELKDDTITENLEIIASKNSLDDLNNGIKLKDSIDSAYNDFEEKLNDLQQYKSESFTYNKIDNDSSYGFSYNRQYSVNNYYSSPLLHKCYSNVEVSFEDNIMIIDTSKLFFCFDTYSWIDEVQITLKSHYLVLASNADKIDGNEYIWIINKGNHANKKISAEIDLNSKAQFALTQEESERIFDITLVIVGFLALIGCVFVGVKVLKSNR